MTKTEKNYLSSFNNATSGGARTRAFIAAHGIFQPESLFFNTDSMGFFGDTVSNYYIPKNVVSVLLGDGTTQDAIALRRTKKVKGGMSSTAYFDPVTLGRLYVNEEL